MSTPKMFRLFFFFAGFFLQIVNLYLLSTINQTDSCTD